ncbi:MAG TPA: hypothetical protein VGE57_04705 [Solimonas sp.]
MFPQNRFLLLVPFFYLVSTRMNTPKSFLSNLSTAWIPGLLLAAWWGEADAATSIAHYALSYLAFISIYEIGYFANDTFGTKFDETPRHRLKAAPRLFGGVIFVAVRIIAWLLLANHLNAFSSYGWLAGMAALVTVMVMHNLLASSALKAVTFFQMSTLRFCVPLLPLVPADRWSDILLVGVFHFVYPRFITYLDSKGRLRIPERKSDRYGLQTQLLFLPLFALISIAVGSVLPLLVWGYYLLFQAGRFLVGEIRSARRKAAPDEPIGNSES